MVSHHRTVGGVVLKFKPFKNQNAMTTNATDFYKELHGSAEFLSKPAIIDFAEKYYARKLQEATSIQMNDTYYNHEETRKKIENSFGLSEIP